MYYNTSTHIRTRTYASLPFPNYRCTSPCRGGAKKRKWVTLSPIYLEQNIYILMVYITYVFISISIYFYLYYQNNCRYNCPLRIKTCQPNADFSTVDHGHQAWRKKLYKSRPWKPMSIYAANVLYNNIQYNFKI